MTEYEIVEVPTHYYQFDQQGVAFNMWYLAFVEEARNEYLAARGYSLQDLLESGHDIHLVHVEIDWKAPVHYGDQLRVEVGLARSGTTSFCLDFVMKARDQDTATASVVFVIIDALTHVKAPLPEGLRRALEG